jgi:hypothetical protein
MTLMEDVAALQDRVAEAQRSKARAEGVRDSAQVAYDKARQELADDFGVHSLQAAEDLLADLRAQLADLVQQISGKLDEIGI